MAREKRIVTQEDLDNEPALVEEGVKVGDEIELGPLCYEHGNLLPGQDDDEDESGEESASNADGPGPKPTKPPGTV